MRKAARKQKKLDAKLAQEANDAQKLENNSKIIFPAEIASLMVMKTDKAKTEVITSDLLVNFSYIYLADQDINQFAEFIANNSKAMSLNCPAKTVLVQRICQALKINASITTLHLTTNYDTTPVNTHIILIELAEVLQHNKSLTSLSMSWKDPNVTNDSFNQFINGLKQNTTLTRLAIPSLNYHPDHMSLLLETIKTHPTLSLSSSTKIPSISFPTLDVYNESMQSVAILLKENLLTRFTLGIRQSFSGTELLPVFSALKEKNSLTELLFPQMGRFFETKEECETFADALKVNQSLTKLNLNKLHIGSEKMSIILNGMKYNKTITDFKFWDNNLNNNICESLGSLLRVSETLTEIDLPNSSINAEGCKYIGEALKINKSVTSLNMFMNPFGSEGCKYLCEGLKFNKTLIRVKISDCQINDEGCSYIGEAIKTNPTLLHLDISGVPIKTKGYNALIEGMKQNNSLTDLTLSKDRSVPSELHEAIYTSQNRNKQYQRDLIINTIVLLIQIARSDAFDMFPLEIWLRIFKHFVCGGIPGFNHIAESILMQCNVRDLAQLRKKKIVRINGKSHLVSKMNK